MVETNKAAAGAGGAGAPPAAPPQGVRVVKVKPVYGMAGSVVVFGGKEYVVSDELTVGLPKEAASDEELKKNPAFEV